MLSFSYPLRTERAIKIRQALFVASWILPFVLAAVMGALANETIRSGFFLASAFNAARFAIAVFGTDDGYFISEYAWLPERKEARLNAMCCADPELEAYRQQVMNLGRRLTRGEFNAMQRWPDELVRLRNDQLESGA